MDINTSKNNPIGTISLRGRFDFNAHRSFRVSYDSLLQDAAINEIVVDLSGVEYMDSSALGMLLMLRDRSKAVNKSTKLKNPTSTVAQILDIANFQKLFEIV
jgi:anti-anti-sigma factor